jgi:hypothetical protein
MVRLLANGLETAADDSLIEPDLVLRGDPAYLWIDEVKALARVG